MQLTDNAVEAAARASWSSTLGRPVTDEEWATMRDVEMVHARAALTAAIPLFGGEEWRPIESAPKDGTPVLLANFQRYPHGEPRRAWWQKEFARDGYDGWIIDAHVMLLAAGYAYEDGSNQRPHSPDRYFDPTHWRPLPPAPQPRGEG